MTPEKLTELRLLLIELAKFKKYWSADAICRNGTVYIMLWKINTEEYLSRVQDSSGEFVNRKIPVASTKIDIVPEVDIDGFMDRMRNLIEGK